MKKHFNYYLFFLIVFLVGFSTLFLACLTAPISFAKWGNTNYYLYHQLFNLLLAAVFCFLGFIIPLSFWKRVAPLLVLGNLIALFFVFIPGIGINVKGASRWLNIGGVSFGQPSEFLKITTILYLSAWIASKLSESGSSSVKVNTINRYHNIIYILLPFLALLALITLALVLQRDISTLGIISLTLLALYFSARTPLWHTILIVIGGLSALGIFIISEPYRIERLKVLLNPGADPMGNGWQLSQQLMALGSGGFFGKGFGMSVEKFPGFLPEAMTDSIFAIIGEELGILGSIILIFIFLLLLWMGLRISMKSSDKFSQMVAIGIVTWISLQAFINIASVSGIFPLAGIPLPFFSYGGSHLAVELFGIGLLLNISKNT